MRATIEFEVSGRSHDELLEQAVTTYRIYLGDEKALLPPNTHMDVSPMVSAGDGTLITWSATVTVSVNNSTFS